MEQGETREEATVEARILRQKGRLAEALDAYERAIKDFPDEETLWYGRAEDRKLIYHRAPSV